MRRYTVFASQQHALPFARHEIWHSIPGQQRQQCCELCMQLSRAVLQHEERTRSEEEDNDREDSRRTP